MIVDCAVYEQGRRREGKLAVEDAVKGQQRPKLEVYGESLFVVLQPACYRDEEEMVELGQIMLFVGADFVVSVRRGDVEPLGEVRRSLEARPDLAGCGPAAVLHAILDQIVDDYFPIVEELDRDIQQGETGVFSEGTEALTSVLQANLAQVAVRQNEDTRRISAWVAIVAMPTMIAGIYGMSFDTTCPSCASASDIRSSSRSPSPRARCSTCASSGPAGSEPESSRARGGPAPPAVDRLAPA